MVPDAVLDKIPLVIAGSGNGLVGGVQRGQDFAGLAGMLEADRPGRAVRASAEDPEVAGDSHEPARRADLPHHSRGLLGREALADAADVDPHARFLQEDGPSGLIQVDAAVVHILSGNFQLYGGRDLWILRDVPELDGRADGDVEPALRVLG